jgi:hypothetical protein
MIRQVEVTKLGIVFKIDVGEFAFIITVVVSKHTDSSVRVILCFYWLKNQASEALGRIIVEQILEVGCRTMTGGTSMRVEHHHQEAVNTPARMAYGVVANIGCAIRD